MTLAERFCYRKKGTEKPAEADPIREGRLEPRLQDRYVYSVIKGCI